MNLFCLYQILFIWTVVNARLKRSPVGPLWPNKRIPYAFSNIIEFGFEERDLIQTTLREIQVSLNVDGERCLEFAERIDETDYILFTEMDGCSSGIGFFPGKNQISLTNECMTKGTIIHEIMHRIGFDHEHSRQDRDQNVHVFYNHAINHENFKKNDIKSFEIDAPYDFHSVIHYNSDALQSDQQQPTLISKVPILVSDSNEIYYKRDSLSPIDVYKIQKLYKCKTISIPELVSDMDPERIEEIKKRFRTETNFNGISDQLVERYLSHSFGICGLDRYWPVDYPLVNSTHRLYKLMCLRKKEIGEKCRFSIECQDDLSICLRPFFKKIGYCIKTDNRKINEISQTVNDAFLKYGRMVKNVYTSLKEKIIG